MTPEQQLIAALAATFATALASVVIAWINKAKLNNIHVLVNSNMTALRDELHATRAALQAGGIPDPTRPPPATP